MASKIKGEGSKAQSILKFATWLRNSVSQPLKETATLAIHLETCKSFHLSEATDDERRQVHDAGVQLWNSCRKLELEESKSNETTFAQVKAFAYLMLTRPPEHTALHAARTCINTGQHALALSILERISDSSNYEYTLLRIFLAWKQGKESVAELFFTRVTDLDGAKPHEDAIGLFYEIGVEFLGEARHDEAKKWLERANNLLPKYGWQSTFDGAELRFNVQHSYCRSLFAFEGQEAAARQMLQTLKAEHSSKLPVLLLSMEHYIDSEELYATLEKTMHSMHLMETNFKLIIHYLHILRTLNAGFACDLLGNFIVTRLVPEKRENWIDISVTTLVWMITSDQGAYGTPTHLKKFLEFLRCGDGTFEFSPNVAQGITVLVWKRIKTLLETNPQVATEWCEAALTFIKTTSLRGGSYEAKLRRKLATCCLALGDSERAQDAIECLPREAKLDSSTRYLTYQIALQSNNEEAAERALSSLASAPKDADKLLFACVSEAEKYGNIRFRAKLLQRLLDKYINMPHPDVDIIKLLRSTASLVWQVIEDAKHQVEEEMIERLCAVFKAAKNHSSRCNGGQDLTCQRFDEIECEWFSENGYNLVMQKVKQWPISYSIRLLEIIDNFTYPNKLDEDISKARRLRKARITQARVILYMTEVRNGDSTAYTKIMTLYNHNIVTGKSVDVYTDLLPFVFEAALQSSLEDRHLKLNNLLDSLASSSPKMYAACADLVLKSATSSDDNRLPIQSAVQLLSHIIMRVRTLSGYDIVQASRWIRCLVQLILDVARDPLVHEDSNTHLSMLRDILEESARTAHGEHSYPQEELDWLATSVFNLAIDFYVAERDHPTKEFALLALQMAKSMMDQGLAEMLNGRLKRLGWAQ